MVQAGHFAACGVAVDDALLRRAHDHRFGFFEGRQRLATVTNRDRFLDLAHEAAQVRPPPLVDLGAARDLARSLAGGTGIGHAFSSLSRGPAAAHPSSGIDVAKSKRRRELRHRAPLIIASPVSVNGACRRRRCWGSSLPTRVLPNTAAKARLAIARAPVWRRSGASRRELAGCRRGWRAW